ncbi:MAG: polyphenol oxidase family protein, partial [Proteobacteria bacterium]|nr:polyphenol oxidase family protein [Pseudomonadota bacterium]
MAVAYPRGDGLGNRKWVESGVLAGVPGLVHGFTARASGDFATEGTVAGLLAETGAKELQLLRQVHGARVARVGGAVSRPEADAWAGRPAPSVLLGILTADCLPVLLCHPPTRTVGLAHAGWRGATAGVTKAALMAMGVPVEE